MGLTTKIEWCDSTVNGMMGCDGCELWNRKTGVGTCYAATMTAKYAGRKGWPASFGEPAVFPDRIRKACGWPDLTGTKRPGKPWLDGRPRMIFLDDMGDTFTESLPLDWIAPEIERMEAAPHVWLFLTKRARRMRRFFERFGRVPRNFWLMVSVTSEATASRIADLRAILGATRLVSYEPMLEYVEFPLDGITGVIFGGESGQGARPSDVRWYRRGIAACRAAGVACFVKQLGPKPFESRPADGVEKGTESALRRIGTEHPQRPWFRDWTLVHWGNQSRWHRYYRISDPKGADPSEWPEDLRVREWPA